MRSLIVLLLSLTPAVGDAAPDAGPGLAPDAPVDAQEQLIDVAEAQARSCSAQGLHALFVLAASGAISGVCPSEQLADVNGLAALRCPRAFVQQLAAEPAATRGKVLDHLWVPDREAELRDALEALRDEPSLREFIEREFLPRLDAP